MMKKWLHELFYVSHSDRRVILSLLLVAAIIMVTIWLIGGKPQAASTAMTSLPLTADTAAADSTPSPPQYYRQDNAVAPERFAFDPNTADSTQLLRLGLRPWQVRNIYKYRAAGGIYRSKEDFARLYGLTVKEYRELEPYISIGSDYRPAATLFNDKAGETDDIPTRRDTLRYPVKLAEGETIDLATADTSALKTVPGIGSYYARRIVEYRERLGGYASLDQLDEIEGFPQQARSYLTIGHGPTVKISINKMGVNELKKHPYINFYQARAIADYRRQYGPITDLSDLRLLPDFSPETIERLKPYVDY